MDYNYLMKFEKKKTSKCAQDNFFTYGFKQLTCVTGDSAKTFMIDQACKSEAVIFCEN